MLDQTKQKLPKVESNTELKPVSPGLETTSSITQGPAWCSLCVEGVGEGWAAEELRGALFHKQLYF